MAYSSDVSGRPEVYVRPFEGTRFQMPLPESSGEPPLRLLLNWPVRLRSER